MVIISEDHSVQNMCTAAACPSSCPDGTTDGDGVSGESPRTGTRVGDLRVKSN